MASLFQYNQGQVERQRDDVGGGQPTREERWRHSIVSRPLIVDGW